MRTPEELVAFAAERGVSATLHHADSPMPTVPLAAAGLGIDPAEVTKNVLFFVQGTAVLVIARGVQRIDERVVAGHFGVGRKEVKIASPDQTVAETGFVAGCVPPFGHRVPLPTLVDEEVMTLPRVYGGTSDPRVLISVAPDDLTRLTTVEAVLPVAKVENGGGASSPGA